MRRGNGAGWGGAASGIPAGGPGWGGQARGASGAKRHDLQGQSGPGRGMFSQEGEERAERRARYAEEMCELYYTFAKDPEQPTMVRISAATHLLNRLDGLPIAKTEQIAEAKIVIEGGLPKRPQ